MIKPLFRIPTHFTRHLDGYRAHGKLRQAANAAFRAPTYHFRKGHDPKAMFWGAVTCRHIPDRRKTYQWEANTPAGELWLLANIPPEAELL